MSGHADEAGTVRARRRQFAAAVRARTFMVAPGVYDFLSLRIAQHAGFPALYLTGYGVAASQLGLPDAGLASFGEVMAAMRELTARASVPVIADADTGFGGLLNVRRTVQEYERHGICAIQLEDQVFPKKCGHTQGRQVVPVAEMQARIAVAVEARRDPDFLIVARTDARTSEGIDRAIQRAQCYRDCGADLIFVESPETPEEFARIGQAIDAPLVANMVEGGRSPVLDAATLRSLGFTVVIYPATALLAAAGAMRTAYEHLARHGTSLGMPCPLEEFPRLNELVGFPEVWAFDERWRGA